MLTPIVPGRYAGARVASTAGRAKEEAGSIYQRPLEEEKKKKRRPTDCISDEECHCRRCRRRRRSDQGRSYASSATCLRPTDSNKGKNKDQRV